MTKRVAGILSLLLLCCGLSFAQAPPPATYVAAYDATGQGAVIAATNLASQINPVIYALGGTYRGSCYVILTTADGASSTLPSCNITFTDADTGNAHTATALTATSTANTVDTVGAGGTAVPGGTFHAKASTAISVSTVGYVSGTGGAMKYAVHFKLEYVGP